VQEREGTMKRKKMEVNMEHHNNAMGVNSK